jgi:translation initiation factor IF-2
MAKMRVHELAKEFGMTSKELLARLQEMKIPAKSHSSTLVDAYVDKIRKELKPEIAERAEEIKKKRAAEEAKKAKKAEEKQEAEAKEHKAEVKAELESRKRERLARKGVKSDAYAGMPETAKGSATGTEDVTSESKPTKAAEPAKKGPAAGGAAASAALASDAKPIAGAEPATNAKSDEPEAKVIAPEAVEEKPAAPATAPAPHPEPAKKHQPAQRPAAKKNAAPAKKRHEPATAAKPARKTEHKQSAKRQPAGENKPKRPVSKEKERFNNLMSQIQHEKERMARESAEKKERAQQAEKLDEVKRAQQAERGHRQHKEEMAAHKAARNARKESRKRQANDLPDGQVMASKDDRYARMATEVEKFQRSKVLEEARAAVANAEREAQQGGGRRKKRKQKREAQAEARREAKIEAARARGEVIPDDSVIKVPTGSTVAEFSELLGVNSSDVIKRLFLLDKPLTLTQTMDDDLIELIADDMGRKVKVTSPEEEEALVFNDDPKDLKPRPPVVTVMGHVDHGKTSLLDAIRSTGVAENEAGGITQHIGASVVNINGRQITFIDTPGHEAFTAMRARGAKITDVVVLVVAADDGVMPQTVEAINHAKAADVPIVVAVNKIDKPGADPSRVRQELTEYGIVPEEWGGENMFVDVSAKKRLNIDDLLETILLQADVLELKANPDALASGFVIEGKLDKGRGPVGTVLVARGTLHVGDAVVVGISHGRVRALLDPKGNNVEEAKPADPVEVLGLSSVPEAGDEFRVFEDERDARHLAEERALKRRLAAQRTPHMSLEDLFARIEEGKTTELNLVVKADVQGSIEALQDALDKMDQSEVKINVIHSAVGGITETDVTLAAASDAIIIGFGVRPQPKAKEAAKKEKVDIRTYRVIYKAIEDINAARVGLLAPEFVDRDTGSAEVRELFHVPKVGTVAGAYVTEGEISREDKIRVVRDGTIVHEGKLASLRRFKDDVKSVKNGYECGIGIDGFQDVHVGDIIEGYRTEAVAREE